jgi:peptide/nickel transport system substrate-binding protein
VSRSAVWAVVGLALTGTLLLAACSSAATSAQQSGGTVVTFGEAAASPPSYIFPMESGTYFTNQNLYQFSNQMYLPLYAFGENGQPVLNSSLSIALPPSFSNGDTVVNITMKHWRWSNGRPITARDVVFWINLLSAATDPNAPPVGSSNAPGPGWGASVPGGFPTNLVSYYATGEYSLTLKLNAAYNPTWFLYNELSQIYPLPQPSWDRLGLAGPVGNYDASAELRTSLAGTTPTQYVPQNPGTASSGALGVAQFLNSQSQTLSTYATNPLWRVVDGPFRLQSFTPSGYVRLVPNPEYSGSPKPTISAFVEEPFTTDNAEFDALRSGALTIGYIPIQDLAQRASLEQKGYAFAPWYGYGFGYLSYNYTNPAAAPIFSQLYFRQAVQSLVDQPQYIRDFAAGYGAPESGPVPVLPASNPFESPLERKGPVYPFSPTAAIQLLSSHGWKVVPGGTSYCQRPGTGSGQCGAGISLDAKLSFDLLYPSGSVESNNEMEALQSVARAKAGIDLALHSAPYQQVTSVALNGCTPSNPCTNWEIANWVNYWTYAPDYLPTGGELFESGAGSNGGDYSSPVADADIQATHTAPSQSAELAALFRYQDYLAQQAPVIYLPDAPLQLTMYRANLKGLLPQNVFDAIQPQFYRLSGS